MIPIILGSLIVGLLQCVVPFIDKIPLLLMTPMEFIILKILLGIIPFLILISIIFYSKKYHCKHYNKKIIILTILSVLFSFTAYYLYSLLIKKSSPGIVTPIIISTVVILSLFMDHIFFQREISKRDVLCIILIGICIYFLTSKKDYSDNSLERWFKYLQN